MKKYLKFRPNRIIVNFILGIVILSLIFSAINSYFNQHVEKFVAKVNDEKISLNLFKNMYFLEKEKQEKILGKDFFRSKENQKFKKKIYNYVLSQLINNTLLEQYVKKIQLEINDQQIKKIILNSNSFKKNEVFNKGKYFDYLASVNLTHNEYVDLIKKKLSTEHLINSISNTNFLLEEEKENFLNLLSQKRVIVKSILNINSFIDKQTVHDTEIKNYFEKNKNIFYIPEKFKIIYAQIKAENFKKRCSKKDVSEWYLKNINNYLTKEKRKYSVIQIKNKQEAILILNELKKNKNFSKLAKKKSIDPISSKKGGDIGWFSNQSIPDEIKNTNLEKENEISNIIPFRDQFLIVKLDKILPSKKKKLEEVYRIIEKTLNYKNSLELYHKKIKKISETIKTYPDQFNLILKKNKISAQETDWFDKNSIPKILNIPILKKIIFDTNFIEKHKEKIKLNTQFVILKNHQSFLIQSKNFQDKKNLTLQQARKHISEILKIIKAKKEIKTISEKIILELKKGKTHLFNKFNLHFSNPEILSRYDKNPINTTIFSLPKTKKDKKIYTLYQDKNGNIEIILLQNVYNKSFSKREKNIILEYLEKNYTETIFNAILKNLYKTSKIEYEKIEEI